MDWIIFTNLDVRLSCLLMAEDFLLKRNFDCKMEILTFKLLTFKMEILTYPLVPKIRKNCVFVEYFSLSWNSKNSSFVDVK
jgi:hypothetical protein